MEGEAAGAEISQTPRQLGYAMPAEWESHEATWLAWPHHRLDWPGKFHPITWVYCDIVRRLARYEKVRILVADEKASRRVGNLLRRCGAESASVEFFQYPTDRSWTRDFCPIFVRNGKGQVGITDWHFNGWAKYPNWKQDDGAPGYIAERLGLRRWQPQWNGRRIVLEGGSIDVNGHGTLLTTEECLLSPVQARNPGMSRGEIEAALAEYLGVRKVLWLRNGIAGDDTHGHVDDLARFTGPGTIVQASESDPTDANYTALQENRELLEGMTDQDGNTLQVVPLPMPEPVIFRGQRLPASYANFYIANETVLVPTFNDPNDRIALGILADLFPGRKVIGIHGADLVWGLGTIHCMTQQQPAAGFYQ